MTSGSVDLKDGHVGRSADHEEDEKDGAYWDIDTDCRYATKRCGGGGIRRMEGHGGSLGEVLVKHDWREDSSDHGQADLSSLKHCGRYDERKDRRW